MKKTYIRPQIMIEAFTPNNYVAACYKLACEVGYKPGRLNYSNGDEWNAKEYGNVSHSNAGTADTCADASANRFLSDTTFSANSVVQEHNGEQGWISGEIDLYVDSNHDGVVSAGDMVYWHTFDANKNRRWNHKGHLQQADANHPNHS